MGLENLLPIVNWPTKSGEYNIIQLEIEGRPWIRFSNVEGSLGQNHPEILEQALSEFKLEFMEVSSRDEAKLLIPSITGEKYSVTGMGKCDVVLTNNSVYFHDQSYCYGLSINEGHIEWIKPLIHEWKVYTL